VVEWRDVCFLNEDGRPVKMVPDTYFAIDNQTHVWYSSGMIRRKECS
jgi:hypothetical protein